MFENLNVEIENIYFSLYFVFQTYASSLQKYRKNVFFLLSIIDKEEISEQF